MLWEELDCDGMKALFNSDDNKYCFHFTLDHSAKTYAIGMGMPEFEALSEAMQKEIADKVIAKLRPEAVVTNGTEAGGATVGSDDKVAIVFEVTAPTFKPGNVNYIAVADGEGLISSDADLFELEPSIRVSPTQVNSGDTVTVFAQDFETGAFVDPQTGGTTGVPDGYGRTAHGQRVLHFDPERWFGYGYLRDAGRPEGHGSRGRQVGRQPTKTPRSPFRRPACRPPRPTCCPTRPLPSRATDSAAMPASLLNMITLDNVPVKVDDESYESCGSDNANAVPTSNAGQFVATIHLAPSIRVASPTPR